MTADRPTPLIALLTAHWESRTEEGWITRQVAGALACVADVQVITPDGEVAGTSVDSVFVVHRLASPIDPSSELRRELLLESIADASPGIGDAVPEELAGLIDRGLIDPWRGAGDVLAGLRPDQVLVVGHQNVGALDAVDRLGGDLPVSLVALGTDERSLASRHFDRLFDRAGAVLAVTESERSSIVAHHGGEEKVHAIGAPLAANTSVLGEPNTWVGAEGSLIVLTGVASDADHAETELARLIRIRFPDNPGPTGGVGGDHHRPAPGGTVRPSLRRVPPLRHTDRRSQPEPCPGARRAGTGRTVVRQSGRAHLVRRIPAGDHHARRLRPPGSDLRRI
jgi:hypothetical protein